jgi:hypothetical protein
MGGAVRKPRPFGQAGAAPITSLSYKLFALEKQTQGLLR